MSDTHGVMATAEPKISILMPSLNVRAYIEECLNSVVGQTMTDVEIICIDAGSTDGTLEVLRDYERRDARVRVIVSDKKSYGYQMNLGLDAARGAYVGIVETDDWVESHMFQSLWDLARAYDADVVKSNYYLYYSEKEPHDRRYENLSHSTYGEVFRPWDDQEFVMSSPAIWSGLYRREMLVDAGIRFNETPGASYQDTSFFFMVCAAAQRAVLTEEAFVHYRQDNEASSVNSANKVYCVCDEMRCFEDYLRAHGLDTPAYLRPFTMLKYGKYWWNYRRVAPEFQWEFLCVVRDEFGVHREAGLLDEANFTAERWQQLQLLLDEPAAFYAQTCKSFSAYPGDLAADVGEERLRQDALLRTYGLLGQAMALLAADDADPQRVDDAVRAVARAYRSLSRTERAKFAKRLSPVEQARLHVLLGGAREAKIAEMLAPLRHPAAKRAARVVTYPVRKARAFVRKRKIGN